MKYAACTACFILVLASLSGAQERKELSPDTLLNWLRIIQKDGFTLIYATDDEGVYCAISVDEEGDLLIANYQREAKTTTGKPEAPLANDWSMHIVDLENGRELWDEKSEKQAPDSVLINYSGANGAAKWTMTNSYSRGYLYALKPHTGSKVRYEVFRYVGDKKETKVSQVLTIPKRKTEISSPRP